MSKDKAIIVDIDGTIADKNERSPYNWMEVHQDTPKQTIIDLVNLLAKQYRIILVSGRDAMCRDLTEQWLQKHSVYYDKLLMRQTKDNRKDTIVKEEIYRKAVEPYFEVLFVLDDRNQVVDMWRNKLGLTCLQVAEGDF
ncbi:MAG: polynucleotide kinase [Micrococcaceae bacterium]